MTTTVAASITLTVGSLILFATRQARGSNAIRRGGMPEKDENAQPEPDAAAQAAAQSAANASANATGQAASTEAPVDHDPVDHDPVPPAWNPPVMTRATQMALERQRRIAENMARLRQLGLLDEAPGPSPKPAEDRAQR